MPLNAAPNRFLKASRFARRENPMALACSRSAPRTNLLRANFAAGRDDDYFQAVVVDLIRTGRPSRSMDG